MALSSLAHKNLSGARQNISSFTSAFARRIGGVTNPREAYDFPVAQYSALLTRLSAEAAERHDA